MNEEELQEFELKMYEYTEINQKIKELKSEKEKIKTSMLITLKTEDIEEHKSDIVSLKMTKISRKSLDKTGLNDYLNTNNKDISDWETVSETEQLRIKKLEV